MATVTLDLPDHIAAPLLALPDTERTRFAVAALSGYPSPVPLGGDALAPAVEGEATETAPAERAGRTAAMAGEATLSRLWDTAEEDAAWQSL